MSEITILGNRDNINFENLDSIRLIGNGLRITNNGVKNIIKISKNVVFNGFFIEINANNCVVEIGENCNISGKLIMKIVDGNSFKVGKNTSIGGANFICGEGTEINIGENCMLAWRLEFRTTDSHGIYSLKTNNRINPAENITVGNNVWIGAHSTILKGAHVSQGSIVAIKSLVNKKFSEKNVILGGVPAKVIKEDVYWERPLLG